MWKILFISPLLCLFCFFKHLIFWNFLLCQKLYGFKNKVENEIIMTSWNGLHKLPNTISGKTLKLISVNYDVKYGQVMKRNMKKLLKILGSLKKVTNWSLALSHFFFSKTNFIKLKLILKIAFKSISWMHWLYFLLFTKARICTVSQQFNSRSENSQFETYR